MDYAPPIGQEAQGEAAIYIDGNPEAGIEGSAVPAKAIEPGMRELIHLIRFSGLTPSDTDLEQVRKAIAMLIESAAPGLATLLQPGLVMPDGTTLTVDAHGKLSVIVQQQMDPVGGIRFFEDEMPRPGYVECNAGVVSNFSELYPQMAAYLETPWGQARLVSSLAEYETLHTAIWHTNADGTTVGWQGIGGVAKFYWDKVADTLKMPDLQDMFQGAAGPSLGVGDVQGDCVREATGDANFSFGGSPALSFLRDASGVFQASNARKIGGVSASSEASYGNLTIRLSRVQPTGPAFAPRRWGALACAYLGQPAS